MGNQSVKEWGPILVNMLPLLNSLYQKISKDGKEKDEEKQKMNEALRNMERHQYNFSQMIHNQAEMQRTVEGLRLLVNRMNQNGIVPPNGTIPPNGIIPSMVPASDFRTTMYSTAHGGMQNGSSSKQEMHITMTPEMLEVLLTTLCKAMISETSTKESNNIPTFNPATNLPDEASAPPADNYQDVTDSDNQIPMPVKDPFASLLCCDVCGQSFNRDERKPILLPDCGHSFCKSCLIKINRHSGFRCPTCRKRYQIPAENLPTNFTVLSLLPENQTSPPNNNMQTVVNPLGMSFKEQLEYATRLSIKEKEEEESLLLAQRLQDEENVKMWNKEKKGKISKSQTFSHEYESEDPHESAPVRHHSLQDGMNEYHSARLLMEEGESDDDYQSQTQYEPDIHEDEEESSLQRHTYNNTNGQNPSHAGTQNYDEDTDEDIPLKPQAEKGNEAKMDMSPCFTKKSDLLPIEQDLQDYFDEHFYMEEECKKDTGKKKDKSRKKASRRFKEDMELAIALSVSLQESFPPEGSDKEDKDDSD